MNKDHGIEFRRTGDSVVYSFVADGHKNGKPAWKRVDKPLWVLYKKDTGWCCVDEAGTELSWPMQNGEVTKSHSDAPPQCIWLSKKGEKSYTYNFIYV